MEPIKLPLVNDYQLQISCQASYLTIEAEELSSGRTFSLKLDSDSIVQLTNGLFQDIQSMYQGLTEAVNKTHPGVDVTIQPGGKMKYTASFSAGVIKKEYSFSLDLEEKDLGLESKVNALKDEINRLKIDHEQKINLLKEEIEMVKKENEKANLLISEQTNLLKNELDKVKAENEMRYTELARQMLRPEKLFPSAQGVEFNASSINASHFIFSDKNKTISLKDPYQWYCLECLPQIPSQGQHTYSLRINKVNNHICFGITSSITNWNLSNYRFWTKDGIIYSPQHLSGNSDKPQIPGPYGQNNSLITMIVDMDEGNLTFCVDTKKVNSLKFPKGKDYHAYVSLNVQGDSITLV